MALDLDPRFTFDAFVVGPANRLAVAAARRVADAPGSTYNPLFLYSGSGLGKTHLLSAIGHHVARVHDVVVRYETLEHLMEAVSTAVEAGDRDAFRTGLRDVGVLLLDDVQFLEGQHQAQEELIRAWDVISGQGGQVVLTSDRAPQEIDGLDDRLLSRLSGGLIVDIGTPDYETRVAIARRKAEERGQTLSPEVYQTLARIAFTNVRELQGALNRLLAVQELERRAVTQEEVTRLLGAAAERGQDEFGEFLSDISGTMGTVVDEADRVIADAILKWEGEGYRTRRLDAALTGSLTGAQAEEMVRKFERDVARLRRLDAELRALAPETQELARLVLRDPDRLTEAEGLLAAARERQRPPPAPPEGITLDTLDGDSLALRAAAAVIDAPGASYNPLFVLGPAGSGKSSVLAAIGNGLREEHGALVGYITASAFAADLIDALEHSRLDVWRARYRRADALLVDDLDTFVGAERAQEELFHLFDDFQRAGRQLVFAATAPPQDLPLPDRLRSRLESGLVVELEREPDGAGVGAPAPGGPGAVPGGDDGDAAPAESGEPARAAATAGTAIEDARDAGAPGGEGGEGGEGVDGRAAEGDDRSTAAPIDPASLWIRSRENVLWEWPYPRDWIEESVD